MTEHLERGREAYARQEWGEAYRRLSSADREEPLGPDDLERLATAAFLLGKEEESALVWGRAHQAFLAAGQRSPAVHCAFRVGIGLLEKGELARGRGWLARARRLLEGAAPDCLEQGYLLLPDGLEQFSEGDYEAAMRTLARAAEIGERHRDSDLIALARHAQGRAMIRRGRTAEGLAMLDEAMVAILADEVSAVVVGDVYCSVISGCQEVFDWRRAQEWTEALTRWCAAQPELVAYRGQCLLRRSEVLQLRGDWGGAMHEARRACERLVDPPGQPGIGAAFYQIAELHRLRGELAQSEEAFRQASLHGRLPQPGLALLRLAQGHVHEALPAVRRAVDEALEQRIRPRMLAALVEVALSANDPDLAWRAAVELESMASDLGASYLRALADAACGAVLLARGDARAAIVRLRQAEAIWRELDAPYETARTRAFIGRACRELGDECGSELELEAAGSVFRRLGAAPDLERLERSHRMEAPKAAAGGLTRRETEVLRLIAAGMTNRAIAGKLGISEKTVARHVSNILLRLGLSSRSAATAFAFKHALVPPT